MGWGKSRSIYHIARNRVADERSRSRAEEAMVFAAPLVTSKKSRFLASMISKDISITILGATYHSCDASLHEIPTRRWKMKSDIHNEMSETAVVSGKARLFAAVALCIGSVTVSVVQILLRGTWARAATTTTAGSDMGL